MNKPNLRLVGGESSNNRNLLDVIQDQAVGKEAEATLASLLNIKNYKTPEFPKPEDITAPSNEIEYGTCALINFNHGQDKKQKLVISNDFGEWAKDEQIGNNELTSLEAVAIFVRAYHAISLTIEKSNKNRGSIISRLANNSVKHGLWRTEQAGRPFTLPYRAAGLVVSSAVDISTDQVDASRVYPIHIAGLLNPLPKRSASTNFSALADIFRSK